MTLFAALAMLAATTACMPAGPSSGMVIGVAAPIPEPSPGPVVLKGDGPRTDRREIFALWGGEVRFTGRYAGRAEWQVYLVPMDPSLPAQRLFTTRDGDVYVSAYKVPVVSKHYLEVRAADGPWTIEFVGQLL